jgi:hypothetical protein
VNAKDKMTEALTLTCTVNTPYLPITGSPRLVYLLLEVEAVADSGSLPVNLALVVDVSESMRFRLATEAQFEDLARRGLLKEVLVDGVPAWQSSGIPREVLTNLPRKIDRVKDALRTAVEQLRSSDRFALIAFAGQAVTLIPNTSGADKRRLFDIVDGLDQFQLGDDTRIGRGVALGFDELERGAGGGLANRMLVLTDGFTQDEEDCRADAARARQARIPISTMGLGGEFNEELMIPIADQTGGEAYLLEDPDEIPEAFARELQRAQAVRYRGLEMKLRPANGVEVRAAYRVRPTIAPLEAINDALPLGRPGDRGGAGAAARADRASAPTGRLPAGAGTLGLRGSGRRFDRPQDAGRRGGRIHLRPGASGASDARGDARRRGAQCLQAAAPRSSRPGGRGRGAGDAQAAGRRHPAAGYGRAGAGRRGGATGAGAGATRPG